MSSENLLQIGGLDINISSDWQHLIGQELAKEYFVDLCGELKSQYESGEVYPPQDKIFESMALCSYDNMRVIILGQDPYHGELQANGLAFAVNSGVRNPPSLNNIYKEIARESDKYGFENAGKIYGNDRMTNWAKQGVLLLNTILSVKKSQPLSHSKLGWQTFTDHIIKLCAEKTTPCVFMLWGGYANQKANFIKSNAAADHLILSSSHPSPLSVYRGFDGCDHFHHANEFLKQNGLLPIDWL